MKEDKKNYFYCKKRNETECVADMCGVHACMCCIQNNNCDVCGRSGTSFCLKCENIMTLDEAIQHCKEVADGQLCKGTVNHTACGEEHKQLAEWLEELKYRRENSVLIDNRVLLIDTLVQAGYCVISNGTGRTAISVLKEVKTDEIT